MNCFCKTKEISDGDDDIKHDPNLLSKKKKKKEKNENSKEDGIIFSKSTVSITQPAGKSSTSTSCCRKEIEIKKLKEKAELKYFAQNDTESFNGPKYQAVAYLPVSKNDPYYNMNHPKRGRAVIFNFDRWDNTTIPDLDLSPRVGSEKDKNDLAKCLRNLNFDVNPFDNCGHREMWRILDNLRKEDHTNSDCLLVAIMTHGERNTVYTRDGTLTPVNLIWENFEAHLCPTLAGKPKIFIVQACRGKKYDSGTKLTSSPLIPLDKSKSNMDETDSATFSYVIPNAADIIVAFSCPLGHYSWRNPEKGSWFIQAICKVFEKHAYEMDLQCLFTTVAREVALNYQSNTTSVESTKKKQVTSTSSTLIRTVLFTPKNNFNPSSQVSCDVMDPIDAKLDDENESEESEMETSQIQSYL